MAEKSEKRVKAESAKKNMNQPVSIQALLSSQREEREAAAKVSSRGGHHSVYTHLCLAQVSLKGGPCCARHR